MAVSKKEKAIAYSWVAYMMTHQPDEMKRVLKYGTPSNDLIRISEQPVGMTFKDGKYKMITFPKSLNTTVGQRLLFEVAVSVSKYLQTIPIQAYELFQEIKTTLSNRRKDTLSNYLMVAEAVCHRAAFEFKHEILFAYDSILSWVNSVYDKDLGYLTVRRALEALQDAGFIKVREWGKRGNRSKCTKIELTSPSREPILTYTSKVDSWLMDNDPAMFAVYARENTTRLDVLEQKFHHFADEVAQDESRFAEGHRLFPATDGKLIEAGNVSVDSESNGVWNDVYIDRLLGGLVLTLQEDGTDHRQGSKQLRRIRAG